MIDPTEGKAAKRGQDRHGHSQVESDDARDHPGLSLNSPSAPGV